MTNDNDPWDTPEFEHGVDVGVDIGFYNATEEARRADALGEIELWLDFHKPRSVEEWHAWEAANGSISGYSDRWKTQKDND